MTGVIRIALDQLVSKSCNLRFVSIADCIVDIDINIGRNQIGTVKAGNCLYRILYFKEISGLSFNIPIAFISSSEYVERDPDFAASS